MINASNLKKGMGAIGVLALLSACASTPKVYVDQDPNQNFSDYKTFAWAKTPPMISSGSYNLSPLTSGRVTQAVRSAFEGKGYTFTENLQAADFAVTYTIGARDDINVTSYPSDFYSGYDNWGWGFGYFPGSYYNSYMDPSMTQYSTYKTIKGSIAIDAFDVKARKPVWHGKTEKTLTKSELQAGGTDVVTIVNSILESFGQGSSTTK